MQGQPCECLLRRYNAELTRDLSRLLQHGDESFEHFDLTLYDESARPKMERVFQVCRTFAQTFRPGTMNLLLQGGTGLGKTYLSACIARVVAGAVRHLEPDLVAGERTRSSAQSSSAAAPTARPPRSAWSSISAAT